MESHQLGGSTKPFSTCASHLSVVSLFYCTGLGVYLSSAATHGSHSSATASVMYTVVTPMLNPFIYSLRNKDIKRALKRFFGMVTFIKQPFVLGLKDMGWRTAHDSRAQSLIGTYVILWLDCDNSKSVFNLLPDISISLISTSLYNFKNILD